MSIKHEIFQDELWKANMSTASYFQDQKMTISK